MFCTRCLRIAPKRLPSVRAFSTTLPFRSATETSPLSTPVTSPGETPKTPAAPKSICLEGTVITGLNYMKSGTDPVALKDEEYPAWLWDCLDVMKKSSDGEAGEDAGDEFSKSKKQRKLANKRKLAYEAKLLAEGNLEALQPKVPLQHQSVNLPGEEGSSVEHNIAAANARDDLRRAMRKERKANIKEANYLKSM